MIIPNTFGQIFCGLMRQKFNFFRKVSDYIWHKTNTELHKKNIISVKHRGGSVMVWGCFAVLGPRNPGTVNSAPYLNNVCPSQSFDWNQTLLHDIRQVIHPWKCCKVAELKKSGPKVVVFLLLRVAQLTIRFKGLLLFHKGPGRFKYWMLIKSWFKKCILYLLW